MQRMERGIAGNDGPAKRPNLCFLNESGANGICQNIKADFGKGVPLALFVAQDVVVGLRLQFERSQKWFQMRSQKCHSVSLIRIPAQAHPKQMNVVRHETINRTEKLFADGRV